ncbi:MAG TPA: ABC transporter substrate-binding protein [Stellaceae bacterium]|nr:ABC transporter substrate-binding protein [Stellaceae bacterium]
MRRRDLLNAGLAATAALAMPRIARADKAKTLTFVPTSDLAVLDPVVTFNRPTRNYAYLVFDTLYGIDTNWQAQPQMVAGHEVDDDGLAWTLKLRDGLRFHDKEPVLARDVVASIRRFSPRIPFASALMAATEELSAADDRTVRFRLKRPFPHLPEALAGPGGTVPVIMPERLAATSPYQPVKEIVGSGPYRFLAEEHVSGARAAFARFAGYRPRDGGPPGFTSGPKTVHFDRVEWLTLDAFSAQAALGRGEIDWWESPGRDLFAQVARDRNVAAISHYMPAMGILRFNQLYPPFDNPAMRRALLAAIDQNEAMIAIAGEDPAGRYDGVGIFATGTPLANDAGIEIMRRPRDYAAAKRALAEAGYRGEKIVVIVPTDAVGIRALTLVGAEQMRRAGLNVDLQENDFGTVIRRRTTQSPPDKGGWNVFFTLIDRSIPNTNPFGNQALRSDGKAAWDGWPDSPKIEALRAAWLDAAELNEQRRIAAELQTQLWQDLPFIPMGEYWQTTAYRKDLTGIIPGCFTVFWGVHRA